MSQPLDRDTRDGEDGLWGASMSGGSHRPNGVDARLVNHRLVLLLLHAG